MKKIGRKLFYEIATGNIIVDTGERQGSVVATTVEQDIATFTALSERNRDTFDVIELAFGEYQWEFANSSGYRIDPETKEILFSYPDPNEPEAEPVYQKPLSEEVVSLEKRVNEAENALLMLMDMSLM